ncbi:butyrate kinase [Deinococcus metallilatus]|uniref:Probable butyrate kinase n=1 Tax=Deinococcus metallilatus TaxID=1211322 RepID=A0AAJ5F6L5_9DEIO|nr:butyrate kinase [Deinococcus metallilatus]MBB5296777.1 butyrate kinase [Deinococcus metallilatus]QBY09154.1 butyrate kinase [Deinococcus metallilatus]RXJ09669.1 butyrate kinase [Deinococcus metallilatus]TLK24135.1 butyrate kinase [Deinococcus metallilatus]GMA13807.1 putative butyrate kinase [Deinococcus metallilatus]
MIAHVVNPGSSSVKLACASVLPSENPALPGQLRVTLTRAEVPLAGPPGEQDLGALTQAVLDATADWPFPDAVVARGGWLGQVAAGTYRVTPELARYAAQEGRDGLGSVLALSVGEARGVPAFVVDPQSVHELLPEARVTGVRGVTREARFHALNARVVARRAAHEVGKRLQEARVVVAHLGATTSVTAFDGGRAIDTTGTAAGGGPMGALQAGPLSSAALLHLAEGHTPAEVLRRLASESGFLALTGSANLKELEAREASDPEVQAAAAAFVHQACKAIGEQCGALAGRPDALAITGGAARWEALVDRIERRLGWIAPVIIVPGELELEALAEGAGRVLLGLEQPRDWTPPPDGTP